MRKAAHLNGVLSLKNLPINEKTINGGNLIFSGVKIFVAGNANQYIHINTLAVYE